MYLRKAQAGNIPGHQWEHDGQVIEVDDELAWDLLAIPDGGFSEAQPPKEEPLDPEPDAETPSEPVEDEEPAKPKRGPGRPKKTEIAEAEAE